MCGSERRIPSFGSDITDSSVLRLRSGEPPAHGLRTAYGTSGRGCGSGRAAGCISGGQVPGAQPCPTATRHYRRCGARRRPTGQTRLSREPGTARHTDIARSAARSSRAGTHGAGHSLRRRGPGGGQQAGGACGPPEPGPSRWHARQRAGAPLCAAEWRGRRLPAGCRTPP